MHQHREKKDARPREPEGWRQNQVWERRLEWGPVLRNREVLKGIVQGNRVPLVHRSSRRGITPLGRKKLAGEKKGRDRGRLRRFCRALGRLERHGASGGISAGSRPFLVAPYAVGTRMGLGENRTGNLEGSGQDGRDPRQKRRSYLNGAKNDSFTSSKGENQGEKKDKKKKDTGRKSLDL